MQAPIALAKNALITTVTVLVVVYIARRFTASRGVVDKALAG